MTPEIAEAPTTPSTPTTSSAPSVPSTPSTPATAATPPTVATPNAVERPKDAKSLAAFMQKDDEAASATTPHAPLVTDPAAAATTPLTTEPKAGTTPDPNAQGPIPFQVHHAALENARVKAVAEYKQQHGWAEQFKPEQRAWMLDVAERMKDPWSFHRWFGEQLQANPRLASQRPQQAAAKPQPDVQVLDQQGNVVGMSFSAERQADLLAWERQQMTGEFTKLVQPLLTAHEKSVQQAKLDEIHKDREQRADAQYAQVNKILRFDKLSKDEQATIGAKFLDEMNRTPDALEAALVVFERDVLPGLEKKGEQAALDTQRKKAAGNTANGTGTAPAIPRPRTQKELAAWMAANPDA